jgi:hypothetical protein
LSLSGETKIAAVRADIRFGSKAKVAALPVYESTP